EKYAQDHDIPFTNYASLCRAPEIQDLIQREIEAVNANFARVETIKKFYLIERQLTPEDEELTPTMKLKRSFVNKRYAAEINAMKMATEEINAAGGINGRKIKLILEDSGYDPKRAVLASQKMVERDKVFAMVGPMGSPTVLAAQDILFDAGVLQLFPLTAAEFTFKFDPAKPQERLKFNNLLPYV